ncbi:hypothetical protein [Microbulbifer thermotolerans]|uniref:Glycine zipper n=1 Tax=Microbulbifer thermotolerans TaxID=252514 RepID=A0A143HK28_MICTH|nr:hypothetical protein [Microbulbifer thermotolerans]AMX02085.1 hypothetical protein A3224_05375 [Microbulbifer thermotolerans]
MATQAIKHLGLAALLVTALGSQGCANMSDSDRRIGTGIGVGAVTGALISGGRPGGTAAGAVLGGVGGWLYDREKKKRYYYDRYGRRVYER